MIYRPSCQGVTIVSPSPLVGGTPCRLSTSVNSQKSPKWQTSVNLNYSSYYNLLINTGVRYDATNTSTPSNRRDVYAAAGTQDVTTIEEPYEAQFSQDIDTPSDDLYQVHQAKHSKRPS